MPTNVIMPVLGMAQDSGKIVRWLKKPGESLQQGETLLEIETDKAIQELEAPASGILAQILAGEGDEVPVTHTIAVILSPEEFRANPSLNHTNSQPPIDLRAKDSLEDHPSKTDQAIPPSILPAHPAPERPYGRVLASPKARRLSQEAGLDLASIPGSGPGGAVLAQDVLQIKLPTAAAPRPREVSHLEPQLERISRAYQPPAGPVSAAWTMMRPFTLHRRVQAAQLLAWQDLLRRRNSQPEIDLLDLLVLVAAQALARHPKVNALWQDEKPALQNEIAIRLVIAAGDGTIARPVIHPAGRLTAGAIARERHALETRAANGELGPEDLSGGAFALSYLGTHPIDSLEAGLDGVEAAVLATGRITEQFIPVDGAPVLQPVLNLSLTCDPRRVDEIAGAEFLATFAGMVEEPLMLLA